MGQMPDTKNSDKQTVSLFLSLYLIILVFLIALLSNASFDGLRFETASKSVRDSFRGNVRDFNSKKVRFKAGNNAGFLLDATNAKIGDKGNVFLEELPMINMVESESGKIMYADIKKTDIFDSQGIEIRTEKLGFFRKIAENLNNAKNGKRYEIKFLLGSDYGNRFPTNVDKLYKMAGNIAETLEKYGANPYDVNVGVGDFDYEKIRIIFKIIEDEGNL